MTPHETSRTEGSRPTRLLYIAGFSRSGSTLLDRLLGQIPGYLAVGELHLVWRAMRDERMLCGCGARFADCPFWSRVIERAFGRLERDELARIWRLHRGTVESLRVLPKAALGLGARALAPPSREYLALLEKLVAAMVAESGAHTIVDSSKDPTFGYVLSRSPALDVRVVHLVRDSRAVAYSWLRRKERSDVTEAETMPVRPPAHTAFVWTAANAWTHLLCRAVVQHRRLRYGDLAAHPRRAIGEIVAWLGDTGASLDFVDDEGADFQTVNHTIWGNPDRVKMGRVPIRADREWREKLRLPQKALVTAMTWPLLLGYGCFEE